MITWTLFWLNMLIILFLHHDTVTIVVVGAWTTAEGVVVDEAVEVVDEAVEAVGEGNLLRSLRSNLTRSWRAIMPEPWTLTELCVMERLPKAVLLLISYVSLKNCWSCSRPVWRSILLAHWPILFSNPPVYATVSSSYVCFCCYHLHLYGVFW